MPQDDVSSVVSDGYDRVADEYAALESAGDPWPRLRRVRAFVEPLPPGSRVLDLGCGNGLPATRELAEAHAVVGVDISPEQIERARRNVPAATFHRADARDIDFPAASFDAIVALYLIDNVPNHEYPALFRRIADWLRPGGRVLLSAEPGTDEGRTYDWLGVPMFINTVPTETIVDALSRASLAVDEIETEQQREGGSPIEFVWITAAKA